MWGTWVVAASFSGKENWIIRKHLEPLPSRTREQGTDTGICLWEEGWDYAVLLGLSLLTCGFNPIFSYHSSFLPESYPHDEMSLCFPILGTHRRVNPLSSFRLSVCSSLYGIVWLPVSLHTCTVSLTVSALGVPDSVLTPSCATQSGI